MPKEKKPNQCWTQPRERSWSCQGERKDISCRVQREKSLVWLWFWYRRRGCEETMEREKALLTGMCGEREIFGQGRYRHKVECVGPPTYFWFFTKMPLCSFLLQMNMAKLVFIFCIQNTFLGTKNQNWVQVTKPNKFFSGRSHKKLQMNI